MTIATEPTNVSTSGPEDEASVPTYFVHSMTETATIPESEELPRSPSKVRKSTVDFSGPANRRTPNISLLRLARGRGKLGDPLDHRLGEHKSVELLDPSCLFLGLAWDFLKKHLEEPL
jgi:hypothetical protein